MKKLPFISLILVSFILSCSDKEMSTPSIFEIIDSYEGIKGKKDYLNSPFVAAGDRVYVVGHQDGTFPATGWHIKGEMGGIWSHPVKLFDGYRLTIESGDKVWCLDDAEEFVNYPFFNVHHSVNEDIGLRVSRLQFVPDSLEAAVIQYRLENIGNQRIKFKSYFTADVDLAPTWLADSLQIKDGDDSGWWNEEINAFIAKDSLNPWYSVVGGIGSHYVDKEFCKQKGTSDLGQTLIRKDKLSEGNARVITYFLAGSSTSKTEAISYFEKVKSNYLGLFLDKADRYETISNTVKLTTPDSSFDNMFTWLKYNTDWLVRDVPGIGRGLSAGIPDYPWWFGTDNGYAIEGMLVSGMHEEALSTIDLIINQSRDHNNNSGQIVHEVSTNGVVFNPGNLNTTPKFIHALWKAYSWTGERKIIAEYYEDVLNGVKWIESMDKDGNGYPDGSGMMEIDGLHSEMIDVVSYMYQMYLAASSFASIKGDKQLSLSYKSKAQKLAAKINKEWWVNKMRSYADFRSTKAQATELIRAAIVRADSIDKPWAVEELNQTLTEIEKSDSENIEGYIVHHNWVVNTPMEVGVATPANARKAFETAKNYENRFGMFVTGIDRDVNQEKSQKWKAFGYVGALMTLPTGVQAIGQARYGNPDASLEYLKKLENSFSYALPGSMYEVSPDFGMMVQAWNIYAVAVPVVNYFFGVQAYAHKELIQLDPNLPEKWQNVSLANIKVGNNQFTLEYEKIIDELNVSLTQKNDWKVEIQKGRYSKIKIDGKEFDLPHSLTSSSARFILTKD